MILFRARLPGTPEWTNLSIVTPGPDANDEDDMERGIASIIGSALGTSRLRVQKMNEDGVWEDVE